MDEELKALLTSHMRALQANTEAVSSQSELLVAIVAQNADLIDVLHADGGSQQDDEPTTDLAGRPLR